MYSTDGRHPLLAVRGHRRRRAATSACRPGVAAERRGGYDDAIIPTGGGEGTAGSGAPCGLPVLDELPTLAQVLERLSAADGAMLDAVAGLAELLDRDDEVVEHTTGVGVEHWLAIVGAQTRMDRRLLLRACRLLGRLPSLDAAVRAHRVSFAQLRGLTIGLRSARTALDGQLDRVLASLLDALDGLERPDPDVLVRQVVDAVDELDPDDLDDRERQAANGRYLHLQPRLDGTGGRLVGELDAAATALVDAATSPTPADAATAGSHGAARLDLLLARLVATTPTIPTGTGTVPVTDAGPGTDAGPRDLDGRDAATGPEGPSGAAGPEGLPGPAGQEGLSGLDAPDREVAGRDWFEGRGLAAPQLLVRLPFDALIDDRIPVELLTTLTGGRLRLTSTAARDLLDRAGARLRTIVVDDQGSVLGVGRSSRQPPGWLADALAAIHGTCTGPGCDRPARGAQLDHATPWHPLWPDTAGGPTDLDNLGPLCATTNRAKESAGWTIAQRIGGIRTWTHARTGLRTTTIPTTWRPPDDPRRRRSPRPEPPGRHPGPDHPGPDHPGPDHPGPDHPAASPEADHPANHFETVHSVHAPVPDGSPPRHQPTTDTDGEPLPF